MAARKTKNLSQSWKDKIQVSMLVNRLQDHAKGKVDLKPTQVEAIKVLLKKTAPDLSSVSVGQDENLGPVQVTWTK